MMPVSVNGSVEAPELAAFVVSCQCGLTWNITMLRGDTGRPGYIPCSCGSELVAWSGTVQFSATLLG